MRAGNINLKDVAAEAGVSVSSASHALKIGERAPFISVETQRHVREIALRMGYRVNPSARSLRSGKRHSIAIVCGLLRDRSAISAIESIIAYLSETPYAGMVATCGQVKNIEDYVLKHLDSRTQDAVIFIRDDHLIRKEILNSLQQKKIRVAAIMPERSGLRNMPLAYLNRRRAAAMMVDVLASAGHRTIDYVCPEHTPVEVRKALQDASTSAGISLRVIETPILHDDAEAFKVGGEIVRQKLTSSKATGVAVFSENMAVGIAHGFSLLGIDVPREKSILGYGDSVLFESNKPSISTVSHPITEIGRSIAEQTIAWIESDYSEKMIEIKQFSPRHIPRDSVFDLARKQLLQTET